MPRRDEFHDDGRSRAWHKHPACFLDVEATDIGLRQEQPGRALLPVDLIAQRLRERMADHARPLDGEAEQRDPNDQVEPAPVEREHPGFGNAVPPCNPRLLAKQQVERAGRTPSTRFPAIASAEAPAISMRPSAPRMRFIMTRSCASAPWPGTVASTVAAIQCSASLSSGTRAAGSSNRRASSGNSSTDEMD
jgi:hypothetical protein